ncbi:Uncharacterised protein [Mycobacteroides abscessus subsp. abscessus]|nr:Uncharacterised protein [Mycobacteroides abscessus subsp. abscessus]
MYVVHFDLPIGKKVVKFIRSVDIAERDGNDRS